MKRGAWKIFTYKLTVILIVGLGLSSLCFFQNVSAQRRRNVQRSQRSYNSFSHNTPAHDKQSCSSCHKSPTGVSTAKNATGENYRFPDITDYPDHDSCVSCHRQQFFRGARPAICSICHTKVSPRDKARFAFPKANQATQFTINFPHDIHQDIIANLKQPSLRETSVAAAHFVKAKFTFAEDSQDAEKKQKKEIKDYNNCTICHAPATAKTYITKPRSPQMTKLETGLVAASHQEKFPDAKHLEAEKKKNPNYTVVGHFKAVPTGHDSCFNCHYSEQQPTRTNCAGCHEQISRVESNVIERFSLKFNHSLPAEHDDECTVCHVRITQSSDLRSLNPDVPIFSCGGDCHSKEIKMEISRREDNLEKIKTNPQHKIESCSFCHTSFIGSHKIPESHRNVKE